MRDRSRNIARTRSRRISVVAACVGVFALSGLSLSACASGGSQDNIANQDPKLRRQDAKWREQSLKEAHRLEAREAAKQN